jgi:heat shock protein HspQ
MNCATEVSGSFHIGQIVVHRRFCYRGVIYDMDPRFMLSDEWYDRVAFSRPPKDCPWYHVLVDNLDRTTCVSEGNLEPGKDHEPIRHPLIESHFALFNGSSYEPLNLRN